MENEMGQGAAGMAQGTAAAAEAAHDAVQESAQGTIDTAVKEDLVKAAAAKTEGTAKAGRKVAPQKAVKKKTKKGSGISRRMDAIRAEWKKIRWPGRADTAKRILVVTGGIALVSVLCVAVDAVTQLLIGLIV